MAIHTRMRALSSLISVLLVGILVSSADAFVPSSSAAAFTCTRSSNNSQLHAIDPKISELKEKNTNILEATWNGGAFADAEAEAAAIASRIKSVKDLGWTGPPKRKGGTRPRHRAYGGTTELPIQSKPNYDPTAENCVEKWLSLEEFYQLPVVKKSKAGGSSTAAADTVFVALAGGRSCAERDNCENLLEEWTAGGKFDEAKFLASVKRGRTDLAVGWAGITAANAFFASCIAFPTNPAAKALEGALSNLQSMI